ncbi:hypothetical protein ACVWZA_001329 [Sphingomonas sp. UYAg733]
MTIYAGLDVSDKMTHICAVDSEGRIKWRDVNYELRWNYGINYGYNYGDSLLNP